MCMEPMRGQRPWIVVCECENLLRGFERYEEARGRGQFHAKARDHWGRVHVLRLGDKQEYIVHRWGASRRERSRLVRLSLRRTTWPSGAEGTRARPTGSQARGGAV